MVSLLGFCYGQNPANKKGKYHQTIKSSDSLKIRYEDYLYLDSIAKVYGDSILLIVDSLLKDKAFLKSTDSLSLSNYRETIYLAQKLQVPAAPIGWTNDYEHIFTLREIEIFDSIISDFEFKTTNEIVIVTVDSSMTTIDKFDSLFLSIHNAWGVGKKDKDNGIVFGFSAGLRKIRINKGDGIAVKLSDKETKEIIDDIIIPEFKAGNYFEGTRKGLLAIMEKTR